MTTLLCPGGHFGSAATEYLPRPDAPGDFAWQPGEFLPAA